ncbi:MAG: hypothetical protein ACR2FF_08385 [Mycobacteriales bacterium]
MYGKAGPAAGAGPALAYTGLHTIGLIVTAITLLVAGIALLRLVPRRSA